MAKTRNRMYEPYGYREGEQYFSIRNAIDNEIVYNRRTDKEQDEALDALSGDVQNIQETLGTITSGGSYETIDARITENKDNIQNIYDNAFWHANYNTETEALDFANSGGTIVESVPMSAIIPTTLIESASYDKEAKAIVIKFDNGDVVKVDCTDLIDIDEFGPGLELIDNSALAVKKDETSEQVVIDESGTTADVLTVSDDGVKVANVQKAIDVEKNRATAAEEALDAKIEEEKNARTESDNSLRGLINSETTERINQDRILENRIADEEQRAKDAENALDRELNTLDSNIDNEVIARQAADTRLENLINSTKSEVEASIAAEKARAEGAEAQLSNDLEAEVQRATEVENALWEAIGQPTGETESLLARVIALEEKMAMFEGAIKINPGMSETDSETSVYMFIEGEWHDITELLGALTNEKF